ncbi:MAG: hypothetical protein KAU01_11960 [Candidatus Cloacimonetes bacterium]|nr:hypothetical protein [Candidatus Cloacimonadota bacterium]
MEIHNLLLEIKLIDNSTSVKDFLLEISLYNKANKGQIEVNVLKEIEKEEI